MKYIYIFLSILILSCGLENKNNAIELNNKGLAKHELGDYNGAIVDYNKAIELDPNLAAAYANKESCKTRIRRLQWSSSRL